MVRGKTRARWVELCLLRSWKWQDFLTPNPQIFPPYRVFPGRSFGISRNETRKIQVYSERSASWLSFDVFSVQLLSESFIERGQTCIKSCSCFALQFWWLFPFAYCIDNIDYIMADLRCDLGFCFHANH